MGVHLKLAVDAYCTQVRLRGRARSSRQPSSIGTARLCCGWYDFVPIATRLWHFYGRLEWDSWIRWRNDGRHGVCVPSNGVVLKTIELAANSVLENLAEELCRRTIPSTTSCRPCTRYLASQHGASLLGTLCDVVRNPRCRSVVLFGTSTWLSCQARLKPRFRVCQR